VSKKAVFVNIGFDPTAALDVLAALGLSTGDLLMLVYPAATDGSSKLRSEQTRTQIKTHLDLLRTRGRSIALKEMELNVADVKASLATLVDAIAEVKRAGYKVYIELTGGVRIITVLMMLVSACFSNLVDEVTLISEVTQERISLPIVPPPVLNERLLGAILGVLANKGNAKRKELSKEIGVSESSVSRAVSRLKNLGLLNESLRTLSISDRFKNVSPIFSRLVEYLHFQELK